jgi:hypothetical protein
VVVRKIKQSATWQVVNIKRNRHLDMSLIYPVQVKLIIRTIVSEACVWTARSERKQHKSVIKTLPRLRTTIQEFRTPCSAGNKITSRSNNFLEVSTQFCLINFNFEA